MPRGGIQFLWTLITNAYIIGFVKGKIFTGKSKHICLPGLNCYSCPGSLGACPLGALQAVLGSSNFRFSFYLFGFFLILGTLFGRLICGFLCPFGWIQELLHKIPFPKKIKSFPLDRPLRYAKYLILLIFVILLPLFAVDAFGNGAPWFCKWICPAGTLEAGIPLVLTNPALAQAVGFLYRWKLFLLLCTLIFSLLIFRPFCKYICPLGAIYALFNRVSVYRYQVDSERCIRCGRCRRACPMQVKPDIEANHPECIRCGACREVCPVSAIETGFLNAGGSGSEKRRGIEGEEQL